MAERESERQAGQGRERGRERARECTVKQCSLVLRAHRTDSGDRETSAWAQQRGGAVNDDWLSQ